jgi:type IV pilus assembly protein PilQ
VNNTRKLSGVKYLSALTATVFSLAIGLIGTAGGVGDASPGPRSVQIEGIEVVKFQGHNVIRVKSSQALDYSSYPLYEPPGIKVQFPGASLGSLEGVIPIDKDLISEIRAIQGEEAGAPMAEIQILLTAPTPYRLVTEGSFLFVHLEGSPGAHAASDAKSTDEVKVSPADTNEKGGEAEAALGASLKEGLPQMNPFRVPQASRLLELLIDEQKEGTRIALIGDGEISNYNAFTIEDPNRIVVDVWDVGHTFKTRKMNVKSHELAGVRIGTYPEKVRLVFDMPPELASFPPYSLEKGQGKLILCLGEMARGGKVELGNPPVKDASIDASPVTPTSNEVAMAGATKSAREDPDDVQVAPPASQQGFDAEGGQVVLEEASPVEKSAEEPLRDEGAVKSAASATGTMTSPEDMAAPTSEVMEEDEPPVLADPVRVDPGETGSSTVAAPEVQTAQVQEHALSSEPGQKEITVETVDDMSSETRGSFLQETTTQMVSTGSVPTSDGYAPEKVVSLAQISPSLDTEEQGHGIAINTGMTPGKVYMGEKINLDFQDIDISNVFRLLAEVSDRNIIISDKVSGTVTMRVKDIPWDQALDLILATYKLGSVEMGNVIRVAPLAELRQEQEERIQIAEAKRQARQKAYEDAKNLAKLQQEASDLQRDFIEKRIRINYADAREIERQVKPLLTDKQVLDVKKKGETIVDERTNTLTIRDFPDVIAKIEDYIGSVDLPTPQVLIEARIVEANSTFARELGVQWGANWAGARGDWGYKTGERMGPPNDWTERTGDKEADFLSGVNIPQFLVDLPAAAAAGINPAAAGVSIGRIAGDLLNLDLRLSAAEQEGITKIISRPKVMTMDNVEAVIAQGREIPYTQVNPEGNVSVVWKEALLRATVTPRISPDKRVHLKLNITNDDIDPSITSSQGEPAITKQEATTEVLVANGETVVIGGIFKETSSDKEGGVPGLKDMPVINWLFKQTSKSSDQRELLIFMTPYIVTPGI